MERHSTIRGRVKDKVALKAAVYYGFRHGTDDVTIQANKTLAEVLLQEDGYVYQVSLALGTAAMLKSLLYIGCREVNWHLRSPNPAGGNQRAVV
jgi:hypothetical protein